MPVFFAFVFPLRLFLLFGGWGGGTGKRGQSMSIILRGGKGGTILRPTPPRRHNMA